MERAFVGSGWNGLILPPEHWILTRGEQPRIAELEAAHVVARVRAGHLTGIQPLDTTTVASANGGSLVGGIYIPVAVGRTAVVSADQPAHIRGATDLAGGIGLDQRAV